MTLGLGAKLHARLSQRFICLLDYYPAKKANRHLQRAWVTSVPWRRCPLWAL
jgi:hypothetical protein